MEERRQRTCSTASDTIPLTSLEGTYDPPHGYDGDSIATRDAHAS
jgi:hypothetical protein